MDAEADPGGKKKKIRYKDITNEKEIELLKNKDKKNTQQATEHAVLQLSQYLELKSKPNIYDISQLDLDEVLSDFHCSIQPQKKDDYSVQSMKCLRAALNRHFRKNRGFDIVKDSPFVKSNEMFKALLVDGKRKGLGVRKSYPPISDIDLERIVEFFCHDHVTQPDPKKLQMNIIFYVIYFFCRRGHENLHLMTKDTFKVIVQHDGTEYVMQNIDELDKNHGPDDVELTNRGKMYATNGKWLQLFYKKCRKWYLFP